MIFENLNLKHNIINNYKIHPKIPKKKFNNHPLIEVNKFYFKL